MTYFPNPEKMTNLALIFMLIIYMYFLLQAAKLLRTGRKMLLLLYGHGLVAGVVIPFIKLLPKVIVMISSSLGDEEESITEQVSVSIGLLLGSNLSLLTIRYSLAIFFGLRDLNKHENKKEQKLTKVSLCDSGVIMLEEVTYTTKIMLVSSLSYLIFQIPALVFKYKYNAEEYRTHEKPFMFIAMIIAFVVFIL